LFYPIPFQIRTRSRHHRRRSHSTDARNGSTPTGPRHIGKYGGHSGCCSLRYICWRLLFIREWRAYSTGLGGMSSFVLPTRTMSRCHRLAPEPRR